MGSRYRTRVSGLTPSQKLISAAATGEWTLFDRGWSQLGGGEDG
jgi:hypothetical protein